MNFVTGITVLCECCPSSGPPRSFHGGGEILEAWSVTRAVGFFPETKPKLQTMGPGRGVSTARGTCPPKLKGTWSRRLDTGL